MSLLRAIFRNKETPLSQIECLFQASSKTPHHGPSASVTVKREKGKQLKGVKTFPTGVTIAISAKMPVVGMRTWKLMHRDALSENLSIANSSRLFQTVGFPTHFCWLSLCPISCHLPAICSFTLAHYRSNKCIHSASKVLYCRLFSREHIQMFEQPNCQVVGNTLLWVTS